MGRRPEPETLKYQVIANNLRELMRSGTYQPGDQLPTKAALMDEFSVSLNTVDKAISLLRADGLVDVLHGVGMFVRATPMDESPTELADEVEELKGRVAALEAQMENVYSNSGMPWPATGLAHPAEDAG